MVHIIAGHQNITWAEVDGVISFYHDFRDAPVGKHTIKIYRAEAYVCGEETSLSNSL